MLTMHQKSRLWAGVRKILWPALIETSPRPSQQWEHWGDLRRCRRVKIASSSRVQLLQGCVCMQQISHLESNFDNPRKQPSCPPVKIATRWSSWNALKLYNQAENIVAQSNLQLRVGLQIMKHIFHIMLARNCFLWSTLTSLGGWAAGLLGLPLLRACKIAQVTV